MLTNSGEPRLFLNGNEKTEFQSAPFIPGKLMTMKRSVTVIVGQLSDIIEGILVPGYGPAVQYDEIAIFYKELNKEAMEDIFIKNFGMINVSHLRSVFTSEIFVLETMQPLMNRSCAAIDEQKSFSLLMFIVCL